MARPVKLGDVAKVISGFAFKSAQFKQGGNVPVIKIKNIRIGRADMEDSDYVSEDCWSISEKYHVKTGDILISLTGSHMTQPNSVVGRVGIYQEGLPPALLNQRAGKIIPQSDSVDKKYLYYVLLSEDIRREIAQMASGAASQANVSPSQVESVELNLPDIEEQREIAEALSAYDTLIENNNRRIAILEEMAQSLYREWFVKFRYPGHENAKFIDSPLGKIPDGWEIKPVSELYKTSSGGTPSRKKPEYYGADHWWVKTKELNDGFVVEIEEQISDLGLAKSSAKLFPKDTVVIAMYGATIGKLGILTVESATNQACCAFLPLHEQYSPWFIYLSLFESRLDLISLGQGAAQQNISQQVIKNYKLLVPEVRLLERFNEMVAPVFRAIELLIRKNKNLMCQRDLLLPKLLSGAIRG